MQGHINRGVGRIGVICAIVERQVGVRVAQDQGWDSTILEFLAQAAGECDREILLGKRSTKGFTSIIAAMARVHNREVTARRSGRRRLDDWTGFGGGRAPRAGRGFSLLSNRRV